MPKELLSGTCSSQGDAEPKQPQRVNTHSPAFSFL